MRRGSLALMVVLVLVVPGVASASTDSVNQGLLGLQPEDLSEPASPHSTAPTETTSSEAATESETVATGDPWADDPEVTKPFAQLPYYFQKLSSAESWSRMTPSLIAWLLGASRDIDEAAVMEAFYRAQGRSLAPSGKLKAEYRELAALIRHNALLSGPLRPRKVDTASAAGTKSTTGASEEGEEKGEEKKNPSPAGAGDATGDAAGDAAGDETDKGLQRLTRQLRRMASDVQELGEAVRGLRTATGDLLEAFGALARLGQEPPRCSPDPRAARLQTAATCFMAVILVSRAQAGTNQGGQERPCAQAAELAAARNAARQIDALVRRNEALLIRVRRLEARDARLAAAEERIRRLEDENRRLRASRVGLRVAFETKDRGVTRNIVLQITKVTRRSRSGKPLQMARR